MTCEAGSRCNIILVHSDIYILGVVREIDLKKGEGVGLDSSSVAGPSSSANNSLVNNIENEIGDTTVTAKDIYEVKSAFLKIKQTMCDLQQSVADLEKQLNVLEENFKGRKRSADDTLPSETDTLNKKRKSGCIQKMSSRYFLCNATFYLSDY